MHWLTLCILSAILLVYLLVGGAIFMELEKDNEADMISTQTSKYSQFLNDNTCVTSSELSAFASTLIKAYESGVVATPDSSSTSNWEYGPAVFFSITVVTSIGYGHIAPSTSGGQVFFVFYAIFGIPLTAVILGAIGEKIKTHYKKLENKQMFPNYDRSERIGKRVLFSTVCLGLFFFIPAAIFQAIEDWTYLEAWYYTVVTLTTVGFGDFVPAQHKSNVRTLYKLLIAVWIFLGLAWLSMVLNLAGDFVKAQTHRVDQDIDKKTTEKNKTKEEEPNSSELIEMANQHTEIALTKV